MVRRASLLGRPFVVFFFPRSLAQAGEAEVSRFRERLSEFHSLGVEVVGVSGDPWLAQRRFATKHEVHFPLISDPTMSVAERFGVERQRTGTAMRVAIVVDRTGVVQGIFEDWTPMGGHLDEVFDCLVSIEKGRERESAPNAANRGMIRPGALVGDRYRLVRLIGGGGIGDVWLAEHVVLRTEVAVKFLRCTHTGPAWEAHARERFRFESQIAALLCKRTPNAIAVYDAGDSDLGPYLVMEYVPGHTLGDEMIEQRMMSAARFGEILDQIVSALAAAHAEGIIHRDIKPTNILLSSDSSRRLVVKVADFGVAKATRRDRLLDFPRTTGVHALVGSPAYMAPEQYRAGGVMTPEVDLWALGVVAYEALTGGLPFAGETVTELMMAVITRTPEPASEKNPALSGALDDWFARALSKEPEERFGNAVELLRAYEKATVTSGERLIAASSSAESGTTPVPQIRTLPWTAPAGER